MPNLHRWQSHTRWLRAALSGCEPRRALAPFRTVPARVRADDGGSASGHGRLSSAGWWHSRYAPSSGNAVGAAAVTLGANLGHLWAQSDLPQSFTFTKPLSQKSSHVTPPRLRSAHTHLAKGYPILRLRLISSAPNKRSPGGCDVARRRANQESNLSGGTT